MKKVILSIITISILSAGCIQNNNISSTFNEYITKVVTQNEQQYPIDKFEENCISDKSSTQEINECTFKAVDLWNKEIEKNLALLKNITSKEYFEKIQLSQKKWESYRDSEFVVYNLIQKKEGTMFQNVLAGCKRELIKQRAIELKSLYETLINK